MTPPETVHPLEKLNPKIRERFPMIDKDSRGTPRVYLNTGAGGLTVDKAAAAARDAQGRLNPMPGVVASGEIDTAALHARVRDLVADFLHAGDGREVSFHQSSTAALFNLAFGLRGVSRLPPTSSSPTSITWPTSLPGRPSGERVAARRSGGPASRPRERSTSPISSRSSTPDRPGRHHRLQRHGLHRQPERGR